MDVSSAERVIQVKGIKSGLKLNTGYDTRFRLLHRKIKAFCSDLPQRTSGKEVFQFIE